MAFTDMPTAPKPTRVAVPEPQWRTKFVHEMTTEERLESLKEWAEEKKYVRPGEGGTMGLYNIGALAYGGPLRTVISEGQKDDRWAGQYEAPVGPPSYQMSTVDRLHNTGQKKNGPLRKWIEKRKLKKAIGRNASVPAYVP